MPTWTGSGDDMTEVSDRVAARVPDGDGLGDHPAHRHAEHVRARRCRGPRAAPSASSAMSSIGYGTVVEVADRRSRRRRASASPSRCVDSPASRLSKRIGAKAPLDEAADELVVPAR